MNYSFLRLMPMPVQLGARLAFSLIFVALACVAVATLALLEITSLAPANSGKMFAWAVLVLVGGVLVMLALLWRIVSREVLRPLEAIAQGMEEEGIPHSPLGRVAARVEALREQVDKKQVELDESHQTLRQVEKLAMVGKLAAGVAHSVRNPLTAVKLRLFSLERTMEAGAKQQEDFRVITDAISHVDSVVSNFLEFSRRPKLQLQRTSLWAALDACLRLLENRLAAFPVSTTVRRYANMPGVQADPEQLREVIMNLLLNACEAMDYSGNLVLEEFVHEDAKGRPFACLRITDSGPGIAAEKLEVVFEPFFSSKEYGTGLGLPIAKGIIEEHGGDIVVESDPRKGTMFTIMLPVPAAEQEHSRLAGRGKSPYLH